MSEHAIGNNHERMVVARIVIPKESAAALLHLLTDWSRESTPAERTLNA